MFVCYSHSIASHVCLSLPLPGILLYVWLANTYLSLPQSTLCCHECKDHVLTLQLMFTPPYYSRTLYCGEHYTTALFTRSPCLILFPSEGDTRNCSQSYTWDSTTFTLHNPELSALWHTCSMIDQLFMLYVFLTKQEVEMVAPVSASLSEAGVRPTTKPKSGARSLFQIVRNSDSPNSTTKIAIIDKYVYC